jgi:hypothetical protein
MADRFRGNKPRTLKRLWDSNKLRRWFMTSKEVLSTITREKLDPRVVVGKAKL